MPDLLIAIALNASFWIGVGRLVTGRGPQDGVGRVLATVTAGFVVIVVSLEILGAAGLINRSSVGAICLLAGAAGFARRSWPTRHAAAGITPRTSARSSWRLSGNAWLSLAAAGLASWAALQYLLLGLVFPVQPISDAPIYHLYFATRWWQSGGLDFVATPFGEEAAAYFPGNGDLWLTWLVATGAGPFVKVGQWPFLVVGATALFGVARGSGAPRPAAILPAALWTCLPIILTQSNVANVDLVWTAFYFGAVYFLVEWLRAPSADARWPLAFFALACGIVIGTKTLGAVFVLLLLVPVVAALARRRGGLRQVAWLFAATLVPSAYWYARNIWLTRNPVYPLQLSMFGRVWAEGWYTRSAMDATAYHVPVGAWWVLVDRLWLAAGAVGLTLAIAGVASGWLLGGRPTLDRGARAVLAMCATLAAAHVVLYWYVLPYNTQERFLSAALGLALIPMSAIAARQAFVHATLCVLLAWHLVVVLGGTLSAWPAAAWLAEHPGLRFYPRGGFAERLFPGWEVLEGAASASGSRVAYAGTNLPDYLLGIGLRNHVEYVSINRESDWRPHDYHRARIRSGNFELASDPWPQWYRADADVEAWIANLRRRRIEFLFVARENRHGRLEPGRPEPPRFPIEKAWADANPDRFVDLGPYRYDAGTIPWVRVYRVVQVP